MAFVASAIDLSRDSDILRPPASNGDSSECTDSQQLYQGSRISSPDMESVDYPTNEAPGWSYSIHNWPVSRVIIQLEVLWTSQQAICED